MLKILLFLGLSVYAADKSETDMKAMMEKMKEFSTPSEEHKVLAGLEGNWNYTSTFWHGPDAKPEQSKGTSKMKMILGGRWLQHETKGQAMGMPYEGMGLWGYDKLEKEYISLWFDTMGTGVVEGEGKFDSASQTFHEEGEFSCPIKGKNQKYRSEWKIVDRNNMIFTMYNYEKKKEYKNMEMVYKRK
jgi:hypothetical protein